MRRSAAAAGKPADAGSPNEPQDVLRALENRLNDLEHMVQGLQDSVHREGRRQEKRIARLEAGIEPAELTRAPSEDAPQEPAE
jgi:hypothetical protein